MIRMRSVALPLLSCTLAVTLAACTSNKSPAAPSESTPAPSPTPTPTPTPTTFTISGTVAETAPTTSTLLEGVTVSNGSASTTTDSQGRFTLTNVAAGAYTLTASKGDYSSETKAVTVAGDTTVSFNLTPGYQQSRREQTASLSEDNPTCSGSPKPCVRLDFASHHEGDVEATLFWSSSDTDLSFEFRCGDTVIAIGDMITVQSRNGEEYLTRTVMAQSLAGVICEARAYHNSGPPATVTIVMDAGN